MRNTRREFLKAAGSAAAVLCAPRLCSSVAGAARLPTPPNFVFVLIDDMGWGDLSCFGGRDVATENIDRLARAGLRFEQFYVNAPICSPSRVALSTGQYPHRWRITSFLDNRAHNGERGMAQWLDPEAPMLARLLRQAGYATGHFGKWHMGGQRDVGEAPLIQAYGFDASLTNFEGLGPRVLPLCDADDGQPPRRYALGSDKLDHGPITWQDRSRVTQSYVAAAVDFIDKAEAARKPFFINVWPDDVHSPFFPPKGKRGDGKKRTLYTNVLDAMDEQLGVLFDRIAGSETLRNNTLVLLCSDNGPEPGAGSAGPLRGPKGTLYEGGIRSPLIVWGPGLTAPERAGTVNQTSFLAAIDLAPSLLEIAGVPRPEHIAFDGQALASVLLGRSQDARTAPLFFRRPPDRGLSGAGENLPDLAVREGAWKLLCEYDGSQPQLYDLTNDPAETNNVAHQHPDLARRLSAAVTQWHRSMPPDNGPVYRANSRQRSR
jgi:arylsulfatase A-like enzyme